MRNNEVKWAVLSYMLIFSAYWSSIIQFFGKQFFNYRLYAIVVALIFCIFIISSARYSHGTITRKTASITIIVIIVTLGYYTTSIIYNRNNSLYHSYFLVLLAQTIPTFYCGYYVASQKQVQEKIKKIVPLNAIVFSIMALISVIDPKSYTGGGFINTDYGLNYQTISYMAAYAAGLAEYYIFSYDEKNVSKLSKCLLTKKILVVIVAVSFVSILISGGRGGLATFIVESFVFFIAFLNNTKFSSKKRILFLICGSIFLYLFGYIAVKYVSELSNTGYERIVSSIVNGSDSERARIHMAALNSFYEKIIIGHGIGSIFYEINGHSHNFIFDILVEMGVIGTSIYLIILLVTIKKILCMIKVDNTNMIWLIIFFDGLIMSIFSGYYLAQLPVYWIIGFTLSSNLRSERLSAK